MTTAIEPGDLQRFRSAIRQHLGLHFGDDKRDFLAEVMDTRLNQNGEVAGSYLTRLENSTPDEELGLLGRLLTVPETYFFRHFDQFRAFAEVALRERMQARRETGRLKILSAGCASGEEAYSLAMMLKEANLEPSWQVSILGADINPAVIEKAVAASYTAWALRETPEETQRKWFRPRGREFVLDDAIRGAVRFEQRNLAADDPDFWRPASYDVIFCRNMLMYFSPDRAKVLVDRMARALVPGGYLFLGHAETLRGLSQDFHLCHTHETFYYRRRAHDEPRHVQECFAPMPDRQSPPLAVAFDADGTWVEAIRRSAERIRTLATAPATPANPSADSGKSEWDLRGARDLLRQERFADALQTVTLLPTAAESDADALLLKAVLCVHSGKLADAEEACRRLLDMDELNAGAQYVLALCREGTGDSQAALHHSQTAIYLDPGFAMPRLHLGLLARRRGDRESARRELEQALGLLQHEDSSRLLLFGGGFSRDALLALCRAELAACGGRQ